MKFGKDQIAQGVRLNDAVSEAYDGIEGVASSLDVDLDGLVYVAERRTEMLVRSPAMVEISLATMLAGGEPGRVVDALMLSSWADGFFAALHMVEQSQAAEKEKA